MKKISSKYKDTLRNILFMCGITLGNEYNFICAKCISNPDHTHYKNCRNEYNKKDSLAQFYCIMNYYKSQDLKPPDEFQHIMLIFKHLIRYIEKHNQVPPQIFNTQMSLKLKNNNELNIDQATNDYRIHLLQILSQI